VIYTFYFGAEGKYPSTGVLGAYDFYIYDAPANNYSIFVQGGTRYVGIGTNSPGQKLDVAGGYVRSDTGFCIGSNCVTSLWSNPMTTLGDLLYGGASGAATRLVGNTSTTPMYLKSVGTGSAATAPTLAQIQFSDLTGYPSLTNLVGQLSADVTMTTASTFYDGPSVSLTAGTWLLNGSVDLQTTSTASAVNFTCKLWDGTTVKAAGYVAIGAVASAAVRNEQMALTGIASPTGAATWKISCTSTTASQIIKAAPNNNSPGNYASTLTAVRIQ
jgi:hypothetical protein